MKRNKWTEMQALESLRLLEHWAREGGEVCQHGMILLPIDIQVDRAAQIIREVINGQEETKGILRDPPDDKE